MEEIPEIKQVLHSSLSPKEILQKYIRYLPWVIISVAMALTLAWVKLRYSTPIYNVAGKLLVKDKNPYGNGSEKFSNIFMLPDDNSNLNNEIEIIRSRNMGARVVRSLGLQQQYFMKGKVRSSAAHPTDIPFTWVTESNIDSTTGYSVTISIVDNGHFRINENPKAYNFGEQIQVVGGIFRLIPKPGFTLQPSAMQYILDYVHTDDIAAGLSANLGVMRVENASVLMLSYPSENTKIGADIVNQYMREYQLASLEDKQLIAQTTATFIKKQLDTLQDDLGNVESKLQRFKEDNKVYSPKEQSQVLLSEISGYSKDYTEQSVKMKVLDYMINYVNDPANTQKLVPSNLGITEPSLTQQISEFNQLQLQKETMLKSTTPANQLVINLEAAIAKLRQDIQQNLQNVRNAYLLAFKELDNKSRNADLNISSMPGKEKQLLEKTRQQAILQELYQFLLQKKLETAISSASTISDIKILEPAIINRAPISPNRKGLYTIALFFGLAIPALIIFLLQYLNDKVKTKNDVARITSTPILGEVGHAEDSATLVVKQNNRSYISEQFRIIRSSLQYVLPKNQNPIILVTSSFSGEGKSFISTNMGAAQALSGKKTVIMEMDIRKPKILQGLGMQERKGITNYIVSNLSIDEIIYPVPDVENLYVMPCGPVPPNPAEMLLDEKVDTLFEVLRKKFDTIIIDSAPVGLVSDAITLGKHANAAIYIVRHNYTLKKQIGFVNDLYINKKLPNLSIVINDISAEGQQGYGYGYGYAYGYGYGSGYFEQNGKAGWIKKLFGLRKNKV